MARFHRASALLVPIGALLAWVLASTRIDEPRRTAPSEERHASLAFEANLGQYDPEVRFAVRGSGSALWLTAKGATLALEGRERALRSNVVLRFKVPGARPGPLVPSEPRVSRFNYLHGADASRWVTNVPSFGRVTYAEVKPGVDLVFRGDEGRLEYDFVLAPGAALDDAVLDVTGAERLSIESDGALRIHTPAVDLRELPPIVYQVADDGTRQNLAGAYRIVGDTRVAFDVDPYDTARALVIDPVLLYGSYLGGFSFDQANAVALDASGNVYVAGFTDSPDFPTHDPVEPAIAGSFDAFVAKLDPTGKTLLYSTFLGGSLEDSANAVAVDATGNAYLTGRTQSSDFPTTSAALQAAIAGASNAFVAKLAPDGASLLYSTCLGGSGYDSATSLAVDSRGDAFVAGYTQSPDFPTKSPAQSSLLGTQNAFVAEISSDGTSLLGGSYLGGETNDAANALALDASGNVWIAGYAQSSWQPSAFPNQSPYQRTLAGTQNAFVTEWSPGLVNLEGTTFLGGSGEDAANALAVDAAGNVYLSGSTSSSDFPIAGAYQDTFHGTENAFVTKLSPDLASLAYSTFLGGSGADVAAALAIGSSGEAFVAGQTHSTDFPLAGAFQDDNLGADTAEGNAFFAILSASGHGLVGSSYLGGKGGAGALSLALSSSGAAWVVGTAGSGLPTRDALLPTFTAEGPSGQNAFVAELSPEAGTSEAGNSSDGGSSEGSAPGEDGSAGDAGIVVVGPEAASPEPSRGPSSGCSCRIAWPLDVARSEANGAGAVPRFALFGAYLLLFGRMRRRRS